MFFRCNLTIRFFRLLKDSLRRLPYHAFVFLPIQLTSVLPTRGRIDCYNGCFLGRTCSMVLSSRNFWFFNCGIQGVFLNFSWSFMVLDRWLGGYAVSRRVERVKRHVHKLHSTLSLDMRSVTKRYKLPIRRCGRVRSNRYSVTIDALRRVKQGYGIPLSILVFKRRPGVGTCFLAH